MSKILEKSDNIQNTGFDLKNLNFKAILKFAAIGVIFSLIIGFIIYNLLLPNVLSQGFASYLFPNFTDLSFIFAVIIVVGLLSTYMNDTFEAIIMGLVVGLLTGILQSGIIYLFMGKFESIWFNYFMAGQTFPLLVLAGIVSAYLGYTHLKDRIH